MVNSTLGRERGQDRIYNSRNLYGQFDLKRLGEVHLISTTVEIYMVNSTFGELQRMLTSTTVEIYMVNSTSGVILKVVLSTTVEIYMVNSTSPALLPLSSDLQQ